MPIYQFLWALLSWLVVSFIDFLIKSPYVQKFEEEMLKFNKSQPGGPYMSWEADAEPFFKDTAGTVFKWRNVLLLLCIVIIFHAAIDNKWLYIMFFISMMPLEFYLYWQWVALFGKQEQQFPVKGYSTIVTSRRKPKLGEVPAHPNWLPSWYRWLNLHKQGYVLAIVLQNLLIAVICQVL